MLSTQLKSPVLSVGRIGLEFDTNGIFCAQAVRDGQSWRLLEARSFSATEEVLSGQRLGTSFVPFLPNELLLLTAGFRGGEVTTVLPMEACDLRVLELPSGSEAELQTMVQNEIEGMMPQNAVFDFWQLPVGMATRKDVTGVCSLYTDRGVIQDAVTLIQKSGFLLAGIDGLPTACARAARMVTIDQNEEAQSSTATLSMSVHIGWRRCLLVLVSNGIPILARVPQVGGLSDFLSSVADSLGLGIRDALRLVTGLHQNLPVQTSRRIQMRLADAVRNWCLPICEEVLRSIAFAKRPGLRMVPSACIVMGSGSLIPGLSERMCEELNIDVFPWTMQTSSGSIAGPEYAVAAALSSWEIDT